MRVSEESEPMGMLDPRVAGGQNVLVHAKPDHAPASFTVLNFPVQHIEEAVDAPAGRGLRFERYEGTEQNEKGIFRRGGPPVAWFEDPAGAVPPAIQWTERNHRSRVPPTRGARRTTGPLCVWRAISLFVYKRIACRRARTTWTSENLVRVS